MIRILQANDIDQCAAIHYKNAGEWSHNAQMGEAHLRNIYRVMLEADECFGYGYFQDARMVCFITATTDFALTMSRLKRLIGLKQYLQIIKQIVSRPMELVDMFESRFIIPKRIQDTGIKPYLLTWHNNFDVTYIPMAPIMVMNKALRDLEDRGFKCCITQVDANNARPNRFYRSIGAEVIFASKHNKLYKVSTARLRREGSRLKDTQKVSV